VTTASDHAAAGALADAAGALLLEIRAGLADEASAEAVRHEGDRRSNDLLLSLLRRDFPHDAVLSEEAPDDRRRLESPRVWIVDPLDGTREFSEPPRDDWAVHVALWEAGDLAAGAVAQPALGETFHTGAPPAVSDEVPPRPRIAVSRTRPPAFVHELAAEIDAELVPMGSAGVKVMSVVRGLTDAYVHAGGQYEWDSAAPVVVARAAGLYTSRADGKPLEYNRADPLLPDLLVCRPALAETITSFVTAKGVV
jgi:3'(2'), 5'-bisphosphate nucleotidase